MAETSGFSKNAEFEALLVTAAALARSQGNAKGENSNNDGETEAGQAADWGDAAKDCGTPITTRIVGPQTEADFGAEREWRRKSV